MAEEELLFNFMDNLQSWAEQELRRRGVQDLATPWRPHFKEGSSKGPSGKDGKGKDKRKEFTPGPIASCGWPPRPWWTLVPLITLSRRMRQETRAPSIQGRRMAQAVNSAAKPSHGDGLPTEGQGCATTFPTLNGYPRGGEAMHGPYGHRRYLKTPMLSAMQVKKGLKRKEDGTTELEELRRQLKELLDAGSSNHPRLPMAPGLVSEEADGARYFTKLDLRSGYYQVRIAEGTSRRHMCDQVWLIRILSDAFRTHQCPSNVLHPHEQDLPPILRQVFKILRQNELYVKKEKCSFAKEEVSFLGHRIRDGKLMMDDSKVKAIQEWDPPTKMPQTSLLGSPYARKHPIAFESRKLNDTERVTREDDNVATSYFQTQKKLSPKQASRKAELASMTSQPQGDIMDLLREGLQHDPVAKSLIALAHEGKTKRFWECHDTKWAGHLATTHEGTTQVSLLLPQIRDEVEAYVRTCLVCQQDKVEQRQPRGLLEPLPIAERPWDNVTMDFIIGLPKSEDSGSIIVVVDRFSKYATFIAAPTDCTAEETTRLFLKHVVKYWGLPKFIISDRDPCFTGKFWTELFKLMGSELHFSTSFHPQTDGQTERVGKVSYRVQLPPRLKIHPVFHVSYLKPYHEDKDDPSRGLSKRAPTAVVTSYDKEVEHILADRVIRRRGGPPATEYLVKWKGLPESEASWEPADALWQFQEQIERF
ncbi:Transposon Tf2-12 polyprotein [Vitis vinifera]|uniref:Transposon Tf2-12 polyprotein n=1 Tax=Vitis vinifera TaxID=29760 RepID=A0A438HNR7_VITVI|nr:Transposon Tf2-12 polyprotein [Vitis vinifera]